MSYALTLRHWVERLESNRDLAVEYSSERTYRVWRAYMAGSAIAFEQGAIGLHQLLLSDPDRPWRYGRAQWLAADDTHSGVDLVVDLRAEPVLRPDGLSQPVSEPAGSE